MKIKYFIAGLLAGVTVMAAVPALAESARVMAIIDNGIKLEIAGEVKKLPEDHDILIHNGRTYLPSRYVAEQLGATVNWDEAARRITISDTSRVVEKIVEVPVEVVKVEYVERDSSYQYLPTALTKSTVQFTVRRIERMPNYSLGGSINSGKTVVYVEVKNSSNAEGPIVTDYTEATLTVDGKTYNAGDMPVSAFDSGFDSDIRPGGSYSGFIAFPLVDTGNKNFIMTVPVRQQWDGMTQTFSLRFSENLPKD